MQTLIPALRYLTCLPPLTCLQLSQGDCLDVQWRKGAALSLRCLPEELTGETGKDDLQVIYRGKALTEIINVMYNAVSFVTLSVP